jgi:hemolysin III
LSTVPARPAREELINAVTHGAGLVASIVGAIALVVMAMANPNSLAVPSVVIYGISLVLVYLSSTLYHGAWHPPTKSRLQVFDHCAIYLLIAGTYTPLLLLGIGGQIGWTFFTVIWTLAAAGVVFKYFFTGRLGALSIATYLGMGWLAVFGGREVFDALPPVTVTWVAAGGAAYTCGSFVFLSRFPYAHTVWHLFVIAGSACHYYAISARLLLP